MERVGDSDAKQAYALQLLRACNGDAHTVLPLMTNIRRNPIRDMRDEN